MHEPRGYWERLRIHQRSTKWGTYTREVPFECLTDFARDRVVAFFWVRYQCKGSFLLQAIPGWLPSWFMGTHRGCHCRLVLDGLLPATIQPNKRKCY